MRTGAFNHKGFVFVNDYRFVLILHSGLSRGHDKQVIMRMTVLFVQGTYGMVRDVMRYAQQDNGTLNVVLKMVNH